MARGRPGKSGRSRGEVNEIVGQMEQLSALDGRRPDVIQLKRDCFQKLIRYMTTGIDMSSAFIPATKCVALSKSDLPLKKMLYLYLRSAARQNEAVALLVVQTLLTDCKDADPTIRGLAVRSMCSLRVPELMDNVFGAVDAALKDSHPYVREVGVIGVLKCHIQDPAGTRLRGFSDVILSLLTSDPDAQVIANCLYVLQQLGGLQGEMHRPFVVSLLNHIRDFSDWAQCLVLDVLLKFYRPESETERFDMLEVLDFGLNHTNSAVVMATAKLFLHYTAAYPGQYAQVLESIKGPLQTMLLGREPEIVFATLSNLVVLAQRHPEALADLASDLFCRPEDPSYLKLLKLDALVAVAGRSNAYDVAEEASQYCRDYTDEEVASAAVHAVARIALRVPEVDGILDRLLLFLSHRRGEIAGEAVAAMADVLRTFPDAADACVPAIAEVDASALQRPAACAAYCWVLGEFGEKLQDSPYILEDMVERFGEYPAEVKLALLTAVSKLFFKRAPECRLSLGAALAAGATDSDFAVVERSNMYYRLFRDAGPEQAQAVILAYSRLQPHAAARFSIDSLSLSAEVADKIFDEFNTLSVVYRAPALTFLDLEEGSGGGGRRDVDSIGGEIVVESEGGAGGTLNGVTHQLLLDLDAPEGVEGEGEGGSEDTTAFLGGFGTLPSPPVPHSAGDSDLLMAPSVSEIPQTMAGTASPQVSTLGGGTTAFDVNQSIDMLGELLGGPLQPSAIDAPQPTPSPSVRLIDEFDFSSLGVAGATMHGAAAPHPTPLVPASPVNNLDFDLDLLGGLVVDDSRAAVPITGDSVSLAPSPSISAEDFRRFWTEWSSGSLTFNENLDVSAIESRGFREFSQHIAQANISIFASPKEGSSAPYRFLLFAQRKGSGVLVLVEMIVTTAREPAAASVTVKSSDPAAAAHVKELLQTLLLTL